VTAESHPRFTLVQRLLLAVVPRVVWALHLGSSALPGALKSSPKTASRQSSSAKSRDRKSTASGISACCPCTVYFRRSHAVILISQSFDGELITRILKLFGFDAVRGSSSRGAREGLLGLARIIETGRTAIFTAGTARSAPSIKPKWAPSSWRREPARPSAPFICNPEHAWVIPPGTGSLVPKPFHAHLRQLGAVDARSLRSRARRFRTQAPGVERRHRTRAYALVRLLQEGQSMTGLSEEGEPRTGLRVSDFDFELPTELIAQQPPPSAARAAC